MPDVAIIESTNRARLVLDPLRLRILEELREPGSAATIAARLGLPRQRVGYHVRELEREGLLQLVEEKRKGNCTERLLKASARHWLVSPLALGAVGASAADVQDRFSSAYLLAAAGQVIRDVATLQEGARFAGKKLPTLTLETTVRFGNAEDQHAFAEELANAVGQLVARYHDESAPRGRSFRFLIAGHPIPGPSEAARSEK
jgi:DNA-binding transcriptional ArsR family regulator